MYMNAVIAAAILAFTSSVAAAAYNPYEYGSPSLYARNAALDLEDDFDLYARDAEAEHDDFDLYAREAEPEAEAEDSDFDLYARDAYAKADDSNFDLYARDAYAEPEPKIDDMAGGIHPRDAYMTGYEHGLYARSGRYSDWYEADLMRRMAQGEYAIADAASKAGQDMASKFDSVGVNSGAGSKSGGGSKSDSGSSKSGSSSSSKKAATTQKQDATHSAAKPKYFDADAAAASQFGKAEEAAKVQALIKYVHAPFTWQPSTHC